MTTIMLYGVLWAVLTLAIVAISTVLARNWGASVLIATYTGLVVISVTTATKLINLGFFVPAGVIVYSASFFITDILAEVYGIKEAKTAVWSGFFVMLLFFCYSAVTVDWPAAPYWELQDSYKDILGLSSRIALAGAIAFIVSQLIDVTIFHKLKEKHQDRNLWLRNNVSTWISQLIDTTVFISIAFYGIFPIVELIAGQYVVKIIIAAIDTPFLYLGKKIILGSQEQI